MLKFFLRKNSNVIIFSRSKTKHKPTKKIPTAARGDQKFAINFGTKEVSFWVFLPKKEPLLSKDHHRKHRIIQKIDDNITFSSIAPNEYGASGVAGDVTTIPLALAS